MLASQRVYIYIYYTAYICIRVFLRDPAKGGFPCGFPSKPQTTGTLGKKARLPRLLSLNFGWGLRQIQGVTLIPFLRSRSMAENVWAWVNASHQTKPIYHWLAADAWEMNQCSIPWWLEGNTQSTMPQHIPMGSTLSEHNKIHSGTRPLCD